MRIVRKRSPRRSSRPLGRDRGGRRSAVAGRGRRRQSAGRHRCCDGGEFLEDGAWAVAETGAGSATAPASSTARRPGSTPGCGRARDPALMPDRPERQVALVNAESGFGFGELDVGSPQRLGRPVGDVGAQHVAAFAVARPVIPLRRALDQSSRTPPATTVVDEADRVASGGARVAPEQASDLAFGGAAVDRLLRPLDAPCRARQGGLDALAETRVHRLFLLLSLDRAHQQEGLAPSGPAQILTSTPSRTWRQSPLIGELAGNFFSSLLLARMT